MRMQPIASRPTLGALATVVLLAGCSIPIPGPVADAGPAFNTSDPLVQVHGYVWDPEAMVFSMGTCVDSCDDPPLNINGIRPFIKSLIPGASVSIIDEADGRLLVVSSVSNAEGFYLTDPFKALEAGHNMRASTSWAAPAEWPPAPLPGADPPVPTASYLPTETLRPIDSTHSGICEVLQIGLASDVGVLSAVAKYLTAAGHPTVIADLIDPSKFGGVVIHYAYSGASFIQSIPAGPLTLASSSGDVLAVEWAPPGDPSLPPALAATQSVRGFLVIPGTTESNTAIWVTLLPPATSTTVTFTLTDSKSGGGRPYAFIPSESVVRPGVISYGILRPPPPPENDGPYDPLLCVPSEPHQYY